MAGWSEYESDAESYPLCAQTNCGDLRRIGVVATGRILSAGATGGAGELYGEAGSARAHGTLDEDG